MTDTTVAEQPFVARETTTSHQRFASGTVDLMGFFKARSSTGDFVQRTAMSSERRAELIEQLVAWSTGDAGGFDWDAVEKANRTAPDDFRP